MTRRLAAAAEAKGASFERARVDRLEPQDRGRIRMICHDRTIEAHTVVLAASAWSQSLAEQGGDDIPLDTERGYHIEFAMDACPINRPVSPVDLGFYITPLVGRLRVAGTVELGGLSAASEANCPSRARRPQAFAGSRTRSIAMARLSPLSSRFAARHWTQPTLSEPIPRLWAWTPRHTLAGVTSRIVAGLIEKRNDGPNLSALRPDRFG